MNDDMIIEHLAPRPTDLLPIIIQNIVPRSEHMCPPQVKEMVALHFSMPDPVGGVL